ncbi:MAG: ceramidase domain-containing protein [Polymorphobacter sp.]
MPTTRQLFWTSAATLLTFAATLAVLLAIGPDWSRFAPATCLATHCFCEMPRSGALVLQPANSWSSFGFVVVGWWIIFDARRGARFGGAVAGWYGLTAIFIGIGSVMLHATLTLWGQFFDVMGMYLLGSLILTWALQRWRGLSNREAVAIYVALCSVLIGLLLLVPETRRWLFAVVLVAAIAAEWFGARPRRAGVQPRWFVAGLAANIAAFALWVPDQARALCAPGSLWQGHAAWHLLGALAVACSYVYSRGEASVGGR